MNTPFFYGLVLALVLIVHNLLGFFLGFQTDKIGHAMAYNLIPIVAYAVILWLSIKAVSEEAKDKGLSYGKGVLTGFLVSLYASAISSVYGFIHFTFINTSYADYQIDALRRVWAAKGMQEVQMATAEKFSRFFMSPAISSIGSFFAMVILATLISLIFAIFLKRKPIETFPEAAVTEDASPTPPPVV